MKREAAIHSKTGRLARSLGLEHWGAIGVLEALWHLTAREAPAGDIGKLTNEDIAYGIWWKGDPDKLIDALIDCKWLDPSDEHRLLIHDWSDHADDGVHQKLAKATRFFADGRVPSLSKIPKDERPGLEREYKRLEEEKKRLKALEIPKEGQKDLTKPCLALPVPDPAKPGPARREPGPEPALPAKPIDISANRTLGVGAAPAQARGQPSPRPKIRNINRDDSTCEIEINGKLERMPMMQAEALLQQMERREIAEASP